MEKNSEKKSEAAQVAVIGLNKELSYLINDDTKFSEIGHEALVPLGNRKAKGWITKKDFLKKDHISASGSKKKFTLKELISSRPVFLPEQIELFRWISSYYGYGLAEVIDCAVPKIIEEKEKEFFLLTKEGNDLLKDKEQSHSFKKKTPKQYEILSQLSIEKDKALSLKQIESKTSPSNILKKLIEKNFASKEKRAEDFLSQNISLTKESSLSLEEESSKPKVIDLNSEQNNAIDKICTSLESKLQETFLLYGITGSGKTEVYLSCIKKALKLGGSALVILPEISLAPQTLERFQSSLNMPIGLLHSQVSQKKRWLTWKAMLDGEIKVALGARSCIFAPLKNLSLIIVDEEHEQSFKQSDGLRYNARDIAAVRAKLSGCPLVLGSATPSFESLLNAKRKNYSFLELTKRATPNPLPKVEISDLTKVKKKEMPAESISPALFSALEETLANREQAVLLYNRRGFSSYQQCESCGEVLCCKECSLSLTWHKEISSMVCHFCSSKTPLPKFCKTCRNPDNTKVDEDSKEHESYGKMALRGGGTQKLEEELSLLFPSASVLRMDKDTTSKKGAYKEILSSMHQGKADILIGTQMIAKGHDIAGVTLVGIIDADIGLNMPDFRSAERVFQLITQASGRAGRGDKPGRVIIQTKDPENIAIIAAKEGKYKAFAKQQLEYRKALEYPPFTKLMRVIISSPNPNFALEYANYATNFLNEVIKKSPSASVQILGPSPAPHQKLRNRYRWHLLVKSSSSGFLSALASKLLSERKKIIGRKDVRIIWDIDAVEML